MEQSVAHEGDWTRSFEGEESTTQIGSPPVPHLSSSHALQTRIAATAGVSQSRVKQMQQAQHSVEMFVELGRKDGKKHTRTAYKDKMKEKAFRLLEEVGDRLQISQYAISVSKSIFSDFRNSRENLHRFNETVAACLCAAVRRIGREVSQHAKAQAKSRPNAAAGAAASGNGGIARPSPQAHLSSEEHEALRAKMRAFENEARRRLRRVTNARVMKF